MMIGDKAAILEAHLWNAIRDAKEVQKTLDEPARSQYYYVIEYLQKAVRIVAGPNKKIGTSG